MQSLEPGQCPVCGSTSLYDLDDSQFCPTEDVHPGGVVVFGDGLTKMSGLAPRSTLVAYSPIKGEAAP